MGLIRISVCWLLLTLAAAVGAQTATQGPDPYGREALDEALSRVAHVVRQFSAVAAHEIDLNLAQLDDWKAEAAQSRKFALQCIDAKTLSLNRVSADLAKLGEPAETEDRAVTDARKRLADEKAGLDQTVSSCRLLLVDSEKLLDDLDQSVTALKKRQLLHRYLGVLGTLTASAEELEGLRELVRDYEGEIGYPLLSPQWRMVFWVVVFAALGMLPVVAAITRQYQGTPPGPDEFTRAMTFSFLQAMRRYGGLVVALSGIALFWGLVSWVEGSFYSEVGLVLSVLLFVGTVIAGRTFLAPFSPAVHFVPFDATISRRFWRAVRFLAGVWASAGVLYYSTFIDWPLLLAMHLRFAYTVLFALALGRVVWVFFELNPRTGFGLVRLVVLLVLLGVVVAEFEGYRNLSAFLIQAVMFSVMTLAGVWLVSHVAGDFLDSLEEGRYPWQKRVHEWLGIAEGHYLPGVFWMRMLLMLGVWLTAIAALVRVWNVPETVRTKALAYVTEGFQIGDVTIVPTRIIIAVGVLAVLFSAISWVRKQLDERWLSKARADVGARNAVSTVSAYIGATIAILLALSIAGVDLSNIAIIAGALSVGIGFGLQNIVNNFVSGLILLFERPIKQGDWVVVGTTEGYVKKISVRSTQIQTFDNADVLVPNSELIANQVTNWMLRDRKGRVKVPIGVAYGSDVQKVKEILLGIALTHPQTVVDGTNPRPRALFMGFGASSLDFELRFFIRNVDERINTLSDVNFAIEKAFREADITIPFPQTDVHLHYQPLPGPQAVDNGLGSSDDDENDDTADDGDGGNGGSSSP